MDPTAEEKPRNSLFSKLNKTKSWFSLVVGSIVTIVVITFQGIQFLNTLATKQYVEEIRDYVVQENVKIKNDIDVLKEKQIKQEIELRIVKKSFLDHMEKHAGRLAAERETNKTRAARAAYLARVKFKEEIKAGKTAEEALMATIEYPF